MTFGIGHWMIPEWQQALCVLVSGAEQTQMQVLATRLVSRSAPSWQLLTTPSIRLISGTLRLPTLPMAILAGPSMVTEASMFFGIHKYAVEGKIYEVLRVPNNKMAMTAAAWNT